MISDLFDKIFFHEYVIDHVFDLGNPKIENRGYKIGEDGRERPINRTFFSCKRCGHTHAFSRNRMDNLTREEFHGCRTKMFFLKYWFLVIIRVIK